MRPLGRGDTEHIYGYVALNEIKDSEIPQPKDHGLVKMPLPNVPTPGLIAPEELMKDAKDPDRMKKRRQDTYYPVVNDHRYRISGPPVSPIVIIIAVIVLSIVGIVQLINWMVSDEELEYYYFEEDDYY